MKRMIVKRAEEAIEKLNEILEDMYLDQRSITRQELIDRITVTRDMVSDSIDNPLMDDLDRPS